MSTADEAYYRRRAQEEVERACASDDPRVVEFHYVLSELYFGRLLEKAGGEDVPPFDLIPPPAPPRTSPSAGPGSPRDRRPRAAARTGSSA